MRAFKIEKGVKIPSRKTKARTVRDLLRKMVSGDSVLVERSYQPIFSYVSKPLGIKITTRKEGRMVRVWVL